MGSDNLHHKRKRNIASLKRKTHKREAYDLVLIICEGTKSEPNYLKGLCDELKLNSANVEVLGMGADPLTIVNHAIEKYNKYPEYDKIFCVFDKDAPLKYKQALDKIISVGVSIPLVAITSIPCFEYWLLLHFTYTDKPYDGVDRKSACQQIINELKKYNFIYKKELPNIFQLTQSRLDDAIRNARKIDIIQKKNKTDNPSTKMHLLIEYLRSVKK